MHYKCHAMPHFGQFIYYTVNLSLIHIEDRSVQLIYFMENEKIRIRPLLLCLADYAGRGGCHEAMQQMLELPEPSQSTFSSSYILALEKYHLADVNNGLNLYNFGFQSSEFAETLLSKVSNIPSSFQHHLLNEHMQRLFEHLHTNWSIKEKVITSITRGAALINVWNVSVNFNTFHFLRGFSGHLTNSHLWLFADLTDLLKEFENPASVNGGNNSLWSFQSDYLLRSTMICNNSTGPVGQKRKPCKFFSSYANWKWRDRKDMKCQQMARTTLITKSKPASIRSLSTTFGTTLSLDVTLPSGNQDEDVLVTYISQDVAANIKALEEELHHIAIQLKVMELLEERVTPLNITRDGRSTLQLYLGSILNQLEEVTIPVSWLFLRGALEHSKNIFMKKDELRKIAKECGIVDKGFAEFCEKFTSFGSILDISLKYEKSDTIIIKTDEFLSKLGQVFDSTTTSNNQTPCYAKNGIITTETVHELFGPEGKLYITTLSEIGMVAIIPAGKYGDGCHDECYYMPCARKMKQERSFDNVAVRILLSIGYPAALNYEVAFTKHMLSLCPAARLQSSDNENVTIITLNGDTNDQVTMIYRGNEIGIEVESNEHHFHLQYIRYVLSVFESIAEEAVQDCSRTFTYAFASMCNNEFHMLPYELCDQCQRNEVLQVWMKALKEVTFIIIRVHVLTFVFRNQYKRSLDLPLVSNIMFL